MKDADHPSIYSKLTITRNTCRSFREIQPFAFVWRISRKIIRHIITTNYDTLIEQALDHLGVPYLVVINESDPALIDDFDAISENIVLVFKIHGSAKRPSSVVFTLQQEATSDRFRKRRELEANIWSSEKNA